MGSRRRYWNWYTQFGSLHRRSSIKANLDVLGWWKINYSTFPILNIMAKGLLTSPILTVAVQSLFSESNRVINKYQSRLTSYVIEAFMCLDDWHH